MLFSEVLDVHRSFHQDGCLEDILGDGFLIQSNPVYRKVRAFSLKLECKYVPAYPEYLLMPFFELPRIIERKEIPYVPAARLMSIVETDRPESFSIEDVAIPESYHLHEAAHVIAEHFLDDIKLSSPEEQILRSILAESFANTVDALACMFAVDDIHTLFIEKNSYMHPRKKIIRAMAAIKESMGFQFGFMLTFFTYVHANFLTGPLTKKAIDELIGRYAPVRKIGVSLQKDIRTVCAIGELLDSQFRVTTTGNYFKQQGFEQEIGDLLDFPFMNVFLDKPEFKTATEALCNVIA